MGGKRYGANKDTEKLIRLAKKQDWEVSVTRGNHVLFVSPEGERIIGSLTGCGPGQRQLKMHLIKAGLSA